MSDPRASFARAGGLKKHMQTHEPGRVLHVKTQELEVRKALEAAGLEFRYQQYVRLPEDGVSRKKCAYLDFTFRRSWGLLVLEVDEDQHRRTTLDPLDDCRRDFDICRALGLDPSECLVIVRYNPNAFRVNGAHFRMSTKQRITALLNLIRSDAKPPSHFQRWFLYYDCETDSKLPQCSGCWDCAARAVSEVVAPRP